MHAGTRAGAMHAGTRRAVLSYWQLAAETATRGQAMGVPPGTLRHISQESGYQQGKAFDNQFERALSNLSYAANLAIFRVSTRLPPTQHLFNCAKVNVWWHFG